MIPRQRFADVDLTACRVEPYFHRCLPVVLCEDHLRVVRPGRDLAESLEQRHRRIDCLIGRAVVQLDCAWIPTPRHDIEQRRGQIDPMDFGLGVRPPLASWGTLIQDGYQFLSDTWIPVVVSSLALAFATLGFTLFGEALRDAFDPRLRRES